MIPRPYIYEGLEKGCGNVADAAAMDCRQNEEDCECTRRLW